MAIFVRASNRAKAYTRNTSLNISGIKIHKTPRKFDRKVMANYSKLHQARKARGRALQIQAERRRVLEPGRD